MHGSLKFSIVSYRMVKTKECIHSNKEGCQNYRNKAESKVTYQVSMQDFLLKSISKEAQNLNIVAAILKCTQQSGHVFVTSCRLRDFVHMASDKPFNYPFGL